MDKETLQKQISEDVRLSIFEKIQLISGIKNRQKERMKRLKNWRTLVPHPIKLRHMFMKTEIDLIRSQIERLKCIEASIDDQARNN